MGICVSVSVRERECACARACTCALVRVCINAESDFLYSTHKFSIKVQFSKATKPEEIRSQFVLKVQG